MLRAALWSAHFTLMACLPLAARAASCPENTLTVNSVTVTSTAPWYSASNSHECTIAGGTSTGTGYASYNLRHGMINASAQPGFDCFAAGSVSTHDVFTLTGPPSPAAITFTAQLDVSLPPFKCCASLREGVSNSQSASSGSAVLRITITREPGSTFDLYMEASAASRHGQTWANGTLSFPDLPPGYFLTSCQEFNTGAVPARTATWGHLKASYR